MNNVGGASSNKELPTAAWLENWIHVALFEQKIKKLNTKNKDKKIDIISALHLYVGIIDGEVDMRSLNKGFLHLKMNNLENMVNKLNIGNNDNEETASDDSSDEEIYVDESIIHRAFSLALANAQQLIMYDLEDSNVPAEIISIEHGNAAINNGNPPLIDYLLKKVPKFRSNLNEYCNAYHTMIHLEEAAQAEFVAQFNTSNVRLWSTESPREFCIQNDQYVSKMAEAVEESIVDNFTLTPVFTHEVDYNLRLTRNVSIYGQIKGINKDFIFIEINDEDYAEKVRTLAKRCLFDICFQTNNMTFQLQHHALKRIRDNNLFELLVNSPIYDITVIRLAATDSNHEFRGTLVSQLNQEQKTAAINIVEARNAPLPFLLFGPAGTGKTRTLVAAIEEIVRSTEQSVLVCANSNSACDEIVERLLKVLKFGEMFRMYAKTFDNRKISKIIKPISNWSKNSFRFPSLKFLYKFRVVVCTLSTAGCITRARYSPGFSSRHFSHIFIDECASTHETVTMIPIAGLCTSENQINSSIVLAGDPKQLDAVTKSKYAVKLGFSTSFMEHLFEKPLYQRHPIMGQFNPKYIVQLVKNYRSHPAILKIPNELFYDNKLQASAPKDITNWFIGSKLLPSNKFPIIFKWVAGTCKRSDKDFSLFNKKEVDTVIWYIKRLLQNAGLSKKKVIQSDIGVVTPYKFQCKVIRRECHKYGFDDITIGTAEVFQGQEKPIMIVSTVRADGKLGFVRNPRRMNVIITRAKALLIIVGDLTTLESDKNWRKLTQYCAENNAIVK